ncbi:hypothetical protein JKG47_12630 [Acidithiobacillus sp. MC6.1]|nr:hypothetical protein [Acidithiobacillus sp. MC6.1]
MNIDDMLYGINDSIDLLIDLNGAFHDQNREFGVDGPDTTVTDDTPDFFHDMKLVADGDLDEVLASHHVLRAGGYKGVANVCYDQQGHFYLFSS